jgi:hypothetical protein
LNGEFCASVCICDKSSSITPYVHEGKHETKHATSDQTNTEEHTKIACTLDNPMGSAVDDLRIFETQGDLYTNDVTTQFFCSGIPKGQDGFIRSPASQEPPKCTTYTGKRGDR